MFTSYPKPIIELNYFRNNFNYKFRFYYILVWTLMISYDDVIVVQYKLCDHDSFVHSVFIIFWCYVEYGYINIDTCQNTLSVDAIDHFQNLNWIKNINNIHNEGMYYCIHSNKTMKLGGCSLWFNWKDHYCNDVFIASTSWGINYDYYEMI